MALTVFGRLRRRRGAPRPAPPRLVRVAVALHQPEAEFLGMLLREVEIPVLIRRTTFDVPDMLAAGPRELLVPEDRALEARALLDALPDTEDIPGMRFAASVVVGDDPVTVGREAALAVARDLGGPADLTVVFAHPLLVRDPAPLMSAITRHLDSAHVMGCTGEAVLGDGREVEDGPAVAVWAARLPGVDLTPIRAFSGPGVTGEVEFAGWPDLAGPAEAGDVVVLLADPFTFRTDVLLERHGHPGPGVPIVGGMASGGTRAGDHRLFLDGACFDDGAVGMRLSGARCVTAVSQGCTPIGPEMVITDADPGGVVYALAGRPAVGRLEEVIAELDPAERELAAHGLLLGVVVDENRPDHRRGDFVVRAILGGDPATGALQVGDEVRVGQTVRLHVRESGGAHDDMLRVLGEAGTHLGADVGGVLMFTCNGRGSHMFGPVDHDAAAVRTLLPGAACAGVFCNGEIGPVGSRVFMHGFTATMLIIAS